MPSICTYLNVFLSVLSGCYPISWLTDNIQQVNVSLCILLHPNCINLQILTNISWKLSRDPFLPSHDPPHRPSPVFEKWQSISRHAPATLWLHMLAMLMSWAGQCETAAVYGNSLSAPLTRTVLHIIEPSVLYIYSTITLFACLVKCCNVCGV